MGHRSYIINFDGKLSATISFITDQNDMHGLVYAMKNSSYHGMTL